MRRALLIVILFVTPVMGQQKPPDLTGTLSFDVDSRSFRVERIAVQVGDGGTGRYKAILAGDPSLPTHTIYRPRDLRPFGSKVLLPIVAFGNGGCRNGSGEFRNFLSDIASHGYLVIAIGPAGDAVVAGSEGRTGMSQAWQLLDGVEWATKENSREDSEYYRKLDPSKIAMMGQSCGTRQALQVSARSPREDDGAAQRRRRQPGRGSRARCRSGPGGASSSSGSARSQSNPGHSTLCTRRA